MIPVLRGVTDPTTSTDPAAPLLVLGPSLGTTATAWLAAATRLTDTYRVLRFDLPGHGSSPAATDAFTIGELATAVTRLVDSIGGGRFTYAGVSMGGEIGIELACGEHRDRLTALAVICSVARIGEPTAWSARAEQVRLQGTASMVRGSSERWFAPSFPSREPDVVGRVLQQLLEVDDESYARCCEALAAFDRRADTASISVPTTVIVGDLDTVVSVADGEDLARSIGGTDAVVLADTGHQAQLERPDELICTLARQAPGSRHDAGMAVRREVLSDRYVDASLAAITPETADFQRFITDFAWGSVWTRPGLDRRMRSVATISSLVTAGHWHEVELHLEAGLRNGLTPVELAEVLMHVSIYAGVPAGNSAFGLLKRVLARHGQGTDS